MAGKLSLRRARRERGCGAKRVFAEIRAILE
jgi:hypothetical protein